MKLPVADYEADDVLVVSEPERLRALADDLRIRIVTILRERAASTTELAETLKLPKGTVGHHLKVLEKAGLVRVVRTRKVRALTEKYYGRAARLFVIKSSEPQVPEVASALLRQAAEEVGPASQDPERSTYALHHVRLSPKNAERFRRRVERLADDLAAAEGTAGEPYVFVVGLYPQDGGGA